MVSNIGESKEEAQNGEVLPADKTPTCPPHWWRLDSESKGVCLKCRARQSFSSAWQPRHTYYGAGGRQRGKNKGRVEKAVTA